MANEQWFSFILYFIKSSHKCMYTSTYTANKHTRDRIFEYYSGEKISISNISFNKYWENTVFVQVDTRRHITHQPYPMSKYSVSCELLLFTNITTNTKGSYSVITRITIQWDPCTAKVITDRFNYR